MIGMVAVVFLMISAVVVEQIVVTESESVAATIHRIAEDMESNNVAAVRAHISEDSGDLRDYADNVEGLIDELGLATVDGIAGEAARMQDEICAMPSRYRRQADVMDAQRSRAVPFRWIHDRRV